MKSGARNDPRIGWGSDCNQQMPSTSSFFLLINAIYQGDQLQLYFELSPQSILATRLSRADLLTWVQPSRPLSWDGATLQVAVYNSYARDWLISRARSVAHRTLQAYLGSPAARLEFVVCELNPPLPL
jgi:hypothetical protein